MVNQSKLESEGREEEASAKAMSSREGFADSLFMAFMALTYIVPFGIAFQSRLPKLPGIPIMNSVCSWPHICLQCSEGLPAWARDTVLETIYHGGLVFTTLLVIYGAIFLTFAAVFGYAYSSAQERVVSS